MTQPSFGGLPQPTGGRTWRRPALAAMLTAAMIVGAGPSLFGLPTVGATPRVARDFGYPPPDKTGRFVKSIVFPVAGKVWWTDTFGACRDGCRRHHEGQDLFGKKGLKLLAAVSGTIVALHHSRTGNSLQLRSDADGWYYSYLHINNDSPGTDDGHNAYRQAFAPHIALGSHVRRGQFIAYLGDSGNAETTSPHCHFEIRKPASGVWHSQAVNAAFSLRRAAKARARARVVAVPPGRPPMRQGDRGGRVVVLQRALNAVTGTHLVGDGQFGRATDRAMRNLQTWVKLTVDGVYGRRSQLVLRFIIAASGR